MGRQSAGGLRGVLLGPDLTRGASQGPWQVCVEMGEGGVTGVFGG